MCVFQENDTLGVFVEAPACWQRCVARRDVCDRMHRKDGKGQPCDGNQRKQQLAHADTAGGLRRLIRVEQTWFVLRKSAHSILRIETVSTRFNIKWEKGETSTPVIGFNAKRCVRCIAFLTQAFNLKLGPYKGIGKTNGWGKGGKWSGMGVK